MDPIKMQKLLVKVRLVIGDIVSTGEFASWIDNKFMPSAAAKELDELDACWAELLYNEKQFKYGIAAPTMIPLDIENDSFGRGTN
jgi:hypothetical protein